MCIRDRSSFYHVCYYYKSLLLVFVLFLICLMVKNYRMMVQFQFGDCKPYLLLMWVMMVYLISRLVRTIIHSFHRCTIVELQELSKLVKGNIIICILNECYLYQELELRSYNFAHPSEYLTDYRSQCFFPRQDLSRYHVCPHKNILLHSAIHRIP